jgi:hypothetical protein
MEQQSFLNIAKERRNLVIALAIIIFAIDGSVFFTAGSEMELVVSDLSRIGTIGSAVVISFIVIARQKASGLFGRTYVALAIGLALWLAAESVWGYYEVGQQIERPFPSIADALWIAGYGPFIYHLFGTARFFGKGVKKHTAVIVSVGVAAFMYFIINAIVSQFDLADPESVVPLLISVAYPIFDATCVIPSLLMVINAGRGQLTSIPWIFVAVILFVVGDSMLGIALIVPTSAVFHITMILNAGYLCVTAGLIWYNRMFIIDEKRLTRQEEKH